MGEIVYRNSKSQQVFLELHLAFTDLQTCHVTAKTVPRMSQEEMSSNIPG